MRRPGTPVWKLVIAVGVRTLILCLSGVTVAISQQLAAPRPQLMSAPDPQMGNISGTVTDVDNDVVPAATVVLLGPNNEELRKIAANDNGFFAFDDVTPGTLYHVTISADGFVNWISPALTVNPGQFVILTGSKLAIAGGVSSVTVYASQAQIAVEQVKIEEQQRVLGVIPNFYAVYDHDPAPLAAKLKFMLALRAESDPVIFAEQALLAGANQAADRPNYGQGAKGFGQRMGAVYADGFIDIMIGRAILPSLLHQDPRYFYQGTGTKKSRILHALSSPFICRGDNGRSQPNYSTIGGELASGAISNSYYPVSNRGPGLVFETSLISTGGRMVDGIIQEFILRRFTPGTRKRN